MSWQPTTSTPRRTSWDLCSQPLAAAKEYGPVALEASKQVLDSAKATSREASLGAHRLALRAAPHLQALADSARSASSNAATGTTSTIGTLLARARESCLAQSPGRRSQPCPRLEVCPKAPKQQQEQPQPPPPQQQRQQPQMGGARGGESPARVLLVEQAHAAVAPLPTPQAPRPAPVLQGPIGPLERRTERQAADGGNYPQEHGRPGLETAVARPRPPPLMAEEDQLAAAEQPGPQAARPPTTWRYERADGLHVDIRAVPDIFGSRTGISIQAGEAFEVSEERRAADGVLYLRLADGRGWVFDRKPGVGVLCSRIGLPTPQHRREESGPPRATTGARVRPEDEFFWPLAGPQATSQPLLQLATHYAAQTAKDHDPNTVNWPRSSSVRVSVSMRYGGA